MLNPGRLSLVSDRLPQFFNPDYKTIVVSSSISIKYCDASGTRAYMVVVDDTVFAALWEYMNGLRRLGRV